MSGTIALAPDTRWSATGWLFDWVVRYLAQEVGDPAVAASLQEVVQENLGWADLGSLPAPARTTALRKLTDEVVRAADAQLPPTVPERQRVLEHLRQLSELARRFSAAPS